MFSKRRLLIQIALSALAVSGLLISTSLSYGQNETAQTQVYSISGVVTEIDLDNSKITVNYYNTNLNQKESMTLTVPKDAVLMRGEEKIQLSDINETDQVEIDFVGEPLVNPSVKVLTDLTNVPEY